MNATELNAAALDMIADRSGTLVKRAVLELQMRGAIDELEPQDPQRKVLLSMLTKLINQSNRLAPDFLDFLRERLGSKTDAQLARALEMAPPQISRFRHGALMIGPAIILRIHDITGLSTTEIKNRLGYEVAASMRQETI